MSAAPSLQRIRCVFGAVILLAWAGGLWPDTARSAVRVQGLYEVERVVADQSPEERRSAARDGLIEVLLRLTGRESLDPADPPIAAALARPERWLQQYRFQPPAEEGGPVLWMRFDPGGLRRLLADAHLPLWGEVRPQTLIWLALRSATGRELAAAESTHPAVELIRREARRRGLPVLFPLLDLDDRRRVTFADVWGGFAETVLEASRRYGTEAVLLGRLEETPVGGWRSRWVLVLGDEHREWDRDGDDLDGLVSAVMGRVAAALSARYAAPADAGAGTTPELEVTGVDGLEAYARIGAYLQGLGAVRRAVLEEVEDDTLRYRLDLSASIESLRQALDLDRVLVPDPEARAPTGAVLRYRVAP